MQTGEVAVAKLQEVINVAGSVVKKPLIVEDVVELVTVQTCCDQSWMLTYHPVAVGHRDF